MIYWRVVVIREWEWERIDEHGEMDHSTCWFIFWSIKRFNPLQSWKITQNRKRLQAHSQRPLRNVKNYPFAGHGRFYVQQTRSESTYMRTYIFKPEAILRNPTFAKWGARGNGDTTRRRKNCALIWSRKYFRAFFRPQIAMRMKFALLCRWANVKANRPRAGHVDDSAAMQFGDRVPQLHVILQQTSNETSTGCMAFKRL